MKNNNHNLFPVFEAELDVIPPQLDDCFFDDAFADQTQTANQTNRQLLGIATSPERFRVAFIFMVVILLLFGSQAGFLQIIKGENYRLLAEENRLYHKIIPAGRGVIFDRNGIILAENIPAFNLMTSLSLLPPAESERDTILFSVAQKTKTDPFTILSTVQNHTVFNDQLILVADLDYETAMYFASQKSSYPAFELEIAAKRTYITSGIPSLSHVLGYTGIIDEEQYETLKKTGYRSFDTLGKNGLEKQYESLLRGTFGEEQIEINAQGNLERILGRVEPKDGENLTISIDAALQEYIEQVLDARLRGTASARASIIALDPRNGEILSLVAWPAYDANVFVKGISKTEYQALLDNQDKPLYNRAVDGEFPSGSTIKPVFAAAALLEGLINETTTFLSTGGLRIGIWFFPDWKAGGHGLTNIYWAIADSVNTFFYMIGGGYNDVDGLGITKLMDYAGLFGFGSTSGLDLPSEADGFLPSPEWKYETKGEQWYIGDTYHVAIGQGDFLTTPLQIARATAVFANGGALVTPHLNMALESEVQIIIPEETAQIVRDAMRYTVTAGSAQSLMEVPLPVAGKTGTAQWSTDGVPHSWFTGFAPFDSPDIVITVLVEEGGNDYLAVPIAKDILTWWSSR